MNNFASDKSSNWPSQFASALRDAARRLRRQRSLAFSTIAILALGIGANAAIYLISDAVLFQSGSIQNIGRIVVLNNSGGTYLGDRSSPRVPDLIDWEEQTPLFENVASYAHGAGNLMESGGAERVSVTLATPAFLSVLGVTPAAGRTFLPEERLTGRANVAIISDELWHRQFGSVPSVIGSQLQLNGRSYSIIGRMPRGFRFPDETDVWIPLTVPFDPAQVQLLRTALIETVIARLRTGVSLQRAQVAVNVVQARLSPANAPTTEDAQITVEPFRSRISQGRAPGLALLMGMALLLLLVAVANVSNLVLARASSRLEEMRLRIALGSAPWRINQELMAEPLILSLIGGLVGLTLALWSTRAMAALGVVPGNSLAEMRLGVRVCGFTFSMALLCAAITGAISVATLRRQAAGPPLSARAGISRIDLRARKFMVVSQVAFSFVLLAGTVLVIRSLARLLSEDGNLPSNVLTAEIALSPLEYSSGAQKSMFAEEVVRRVRAIPGVRDVGLISSLPLSGGDKVTLPARITGSPLPAAELQGINVELELISPGYLHTMGLEVVRGRDILESDGANAPLVAVVNESMVEHYWPNSEPLGASVSLPGDPNPRTIVGVVRSIRSFSLARRPISQVYFPYAQQPTSYFGLVMRSEVSVAKLAHPLRAAVHAVDQTVPIFRFRTLGQVRRDSVAPQRNQAVILGAFGILALALSSIGVYSAASYLASQRAREIGIRIALGAPSTATFRFVLSETLIPVAVGLAAGILAALATGRLMANMLYGIGAEDPTTFAAVGGGLLLVALIAASIPASRAVRIDPSRTMLLE